MSLSSHLHELRKKHESLSKEVENQARYPSVDLLRLNEMKREKLRLKDEISRLSTK